MLGRLLAQRRIRRHQKNMLNIADYPKAIGYARQIRDDHTAVMRNQLNNAGLSEQSAVVGSVAYLLKEFALQEIAILYALTLLDRAKEENWRGLGGG